MSQINFRSTQHRYKPAVEIFEILLNGQMVATIYPDDSTPESIKIVSAHFAGELTHSNQFPEGVRIHTGEGVYPPIPAVHISFNPRRYSITPEGIERHE